MHKHSLGRRLLFGACLLAQAAVLQAQQPAAQDSPPAGEQQPLHFQRFDEPIQPFLPLRPRSEAQRDLIKAQAWFSTAHLLQERRNYLEAYRAYQHVVRYDPAASEAYDALWRLAAGRLRRYDAAVRYMLALVELDSSRYRDLQSLATVLSRFDEVPQAVKLLEQARSSPDLKKQSPAYVVLMHKLGQLYRRQERYPEAAEGFQVVLEALREPQRYQIERDDLRGILGAAPEDVTFEAAQVLVEAGKAEQALAVLNELRGADPENARLYYFFAQTYLKLDRPKEALNELEEHLRRARRITDPVVYQLHADVLEKLARKDELIPALEQAEGRNSVRSYFLAEQYRLAGDVDKAEKLFVAMLAQDPKPEGYRGLAVLYRQAGRYDALLEHLGRTWRENENSLAVVQEELLATAKDSEAVERIVELLRKQLAEMPDDVPLGRIYAAAFLARVAERREAAAQLYRAALDRRSEAGWYFELGRMHFLAKEYQAAAAVFAEAAEKTEGALLFQIFLVRSLTLDGQADKALETVERVREQAEDQENRPDVQATLRALSAWVYYYARRYDEAQRAYESLIEDYWPDWPYGLIETDGVLPNALRDAHFALSNIYVERGDLERAQELLLRVLEDDPDDPHANNDLGYLWADADKNLDKAETMIRKAVLAEPENAAYLDSLGWVLFRKQQYEQARQLLEQALEHLPEGDPVIWEHLGDVYEKLQQVEKARHAWTKALELSEQGRRPDEKRMSQIKEKLKGLSP